jgi:hypothetical protein
MSNLSTFYKPAITRADLGLGTANNVTFASIQNTPIGNTTASTVAATDLSASGTVSGTGFSNYLAAPPAIGNTTPAAGTFTTLTANNGTLTASAPVLDLGQTWNNAAVAFTGLRFNVTNTSSSAVSFYQEWQEGGVTQAAIRTGGFLYLRSGRIASPVGAGWAESAALLYNAQSRINSTSLLIGSGGTGAGSAGVTLSTEGVEHVLALRNATNAQTFNIYNTFTSATNHERGFLKWSSNVFQIGTEKGSGGGTARALELQTDGVTRMGITTGGNITIGTGTTNGFYQRTVNAVTFLTQNVEVNGVGLQVANSIEFGSGLGALIDTTLARDAANILAMRRSTNAQAFRIYNTASGTNNVNFDRVNFRWASNEFIIDAEAGGTGTLRGIKIGSATSSLLGFYGATPVDRPATVADPAGGGTVDTEARTAINDIIDRLQELGLIA